MARRVGVFPSCSNNGYIPASFVLDNRQVNCLLFYCFPAYEVLISRYEVTVRWSGTRSVSHRPPSNCVGIDRHLSIRRYPHVVDSSRLLYLPNWA